MGGQEVGDDGEEARVERGFGFGHCVGGIVWGGRGGDLRGGDVDGCAACGKKFWWGLAGWGDAFARGTVGRVEGGVRGCEGDGGVGEGAGCERITTMEKHGSSKQVLQFLFVLGLQRG